MADSPATPAAGAGPEESGPRLDKWLWYARFFKTRTLAARLCNGGRLRVNGRPAAKAHYRLRRGDVLTFPQGDRIRVVAVRDFGGRRGPAPEARTLYEDLAPPAAGESSDRGDAGERAAAPAVAPRDAGTGRPTKAGRRALDRLRDRT